MEASKTWNHINEASDVMGLLQLVQNCMIQRQTRQKPIHSLLDAEAQVYGFKQKNLANNEYYEKFKDLVTNTDRLGSTIRVHPQRVNMLLTGIAVDPTRPTNAEREQANEVAKDQFLVVMFLLNCDCNRYGNLIQDIKNEYTRSTDTYPMSLSAAYGYLVNYRAETRSSQHDPDEGGLSYYTKDGNGSGRGRGCGGCGGSHGGGCGRGGHGGQGTSTDGGGNNTLNNSSSANQGRSHTQTNGDTDDDAQFLHDNLEQVDEYSGVYSHFVGYMYDHNRTSLLLDSCSTVNLITNKNLLHGIHWAKTTMHIRCTAGVATTNLQGWLGDFPEPVWYILEGVANILSFYLVQQYYRIRCDTQKSNSLLLTNYDDNHRIKFKLLGKGLYASDCAPAALNFFGVCTAHDWTHINTVEECRQEYTKHEYRDAVLA